MRSVDERRALGGGGGAATTSARRLLTGRGARCTQRRGSARLITFRRPRPGTSTTTADRRGLERPRRRAGLPSLPALSVKNFRLCRWMSACWNATHRCRPQSALPRHWQSPLSGAIHSSRKTSFAERLRQRPKSRNCERQSRKGARILQGHATYSDEPRRQQDDTDVTGFFAQRLPLWRQAVSGGGRWWLEAKVFWRTIARLRN